MTEIDHPQTRAPLGRKSFAEAIREKHNVMHAVVLRDLRTRFFNHGLGFLIVPLWPFAHLACLLVIYSILGRKDPYGDDLKIFFATGLIPTLTFMYVSRFMSLSLLANKPMLSFPVVQVLDIILARAFLEIIGAILSTAMIVVFLWAQSSDPVPNDMSQAVMAVGLVIILSIGMGIIASVITMIFEPFAIIWALAMVLVYLLSGALFSLGQFPQPIAEILAYNPVLHGVEWLRHTYYLGYPTQYLSKSYLVWFAFGSVFVGLAMERSLRLYTKSV